MNFRLATGETFDHCTVEYVLMMFIDEGRAGEQILAGFAEESKEEVRKRLIAFRRSNRLYEEG